MPIVPNEKADADIVTQSINCNRSVVGDLKIRDSNPCVWFHNSEFMSIFDLLEQELSSSLSRRLLHAIYVHPFSGFFEDCMLRKKPFFITERTHLSRIFDTWAKLRMLTGRGMASVIEWPVRFHVDQPVHAGVEVGDIIRIVERLTRSSWRATWKDDGGRNLMIHLEPIEIQVEKETSKQTITGLDVDLGIDWIRGLPQVNSSPIIFLTTESIIEFIRLLNEVPTPEAPEKDRFPDADSTLEKLLIQIIGRTMKSQLPLILDWDVDHSAIMQHLIDRGFIRSYESSNNIIEYESIMPRSFVCGPIVTAWEASTGKMATVKMNTTGLSKHTITFLN